MVWEFFERAKKVAVQRKDNRSFLIGAAAIRSDGVCVCSANGPVLMHGDDKHYFKWAHAEARVIRKVDKGATVFVVRVCKTTGGFKNARPCQTCINAMRTRMVKKVYYTISNNEFGVIILN